MRKWLARWLGLGQPNTSRAIAEQAADSDPASRAKAAESLATVPEPWAREQLLNLLKDTIGAVRDAAREALRKQGVAAVDVLLKALDNADPKIAAYAAERLGELRAPEGIRSLLLALKFGAVEVRAAAIRALIQYGTTALEAILAARSDPDLWARLRLDEIVTAIRGRTPTSIAPAQPEPTSQPADLEKGG